MDQKLCPKCGAAIPDGNNFCTECGAKIEAQPAPQPKPQQAAPQPQPKAAYTAPVYTPSPAVSQSAPRTTVQEPVPSKKSEYALITPWGWVGITLLLALPVIGVILLIVWACGGCRKLQKRNFARGVLLNALIGVIVSIIITILALGPFKSKIEDFAGKLPHEASEVTDAANDFLGQFGYELDL